MNLSELIHRPSEDAQSMVTSSYDAFQRTTTDAMHLDSIYNKSDIIDSRLAEGSGDVYDTSLYDPSKLLPMASDWNYSSDCSGNGSREHAAAAAAPRSPNAGTHSDQSVSTESFQSKRMTICGSPTLEGGHSSTSSSNRTLVENSPASPVPLDSFINVEVKNTVGLCQRRRTSITLSTSESIGSSYNNSSSNNHFSPESTATGRSGEISAAGVGTAEPQVIIAFQNPEEHSSSASNGHGGGSSSTGSKITNGPSVADLTICGNNVTKETFEEGYIQFVLHHDPMYIGDSIENHIYVRRKFASVPKTGDLSYTTWDVYTLVKKLHNHQIKNWSQLVGQLGLSDVPGRPQFAQRVKRWMRKYRIDSYFDYLLGNPYKFHTEPGEKYSGCLVMGNYQKRKGNSTETDIRSADDELAVPSGFACSTSTNVKRRKRRYDISHNNEEDEQEEESDHTEDGHEGATCAARRTPIAHAGSRKRRSHMPATTISQEEEEDSGDLDGYEPSTPPENQEEEVSMYPREYLREDEEDELASTSSSISLTSYMSGTTTTDTQPEQQQEQLQQQHQQQQQDLSTNHFTTSPAFSPKMIELPTLPPSSQDDSSFNIHACAKITAGPSTGAANSASIPYQSPSLLLSSSILSPPDHSSPAHAPSSPSNSSCHNCERLQSTVNSLNDDVMQLKDLLLTLEERLRQETESKMKLSRRLENLCDHYERWRTTLAEQLLDNPFSDDNHQA